MRFILLLLLLWPMVVWSDKSDNLDYSVFSHIPVLHEGRIKPLDSFARIMLKRIHGEVALPDKQAIAWLAGVVFSPEQASQEKIFNLRVPGVAHILGLEYERDTLFSFKDLAKVFAGREQVVKGLVNKDKKLLTENEQEVIRLYANITDFAQIMGSFSLFATFVDAPVLNYLKVMKMKEKINNDLQRTVKYKGEKIDSYTPEELRNLQLSYRISLLEVMDGRNHLLRIIPPSWDGTEEWRAPWAVIKQGAGSPAASLLFQHWQSLGTAYNEHNAEGWKKTSQELYRAGGGSKDVRPYALAMEVIYNQYDPITKGMVGYVISALLAIIALMRFSDRLAVAALLVLAVSTFIHGAALLARMLILMRPPVSTLYESMIFVSFVIACAGIWLGYRKKGAESLILSGIIASLLIEAANVFAADSDTLEVLVAVLNTNFWLATHVICITLGYAASILCGAVAHIYLLKRVLGRTPAQMVPLYKNLHYMAVFALLFTAIGTMLGGIWADQSWGRFWGWDPKENGALWIVLWLIWLLHARVAGQLHETGFAIAMAFINIVVALAWVGVNLLSVGLHSYGFTDTAASGLFVFCVAEVLFISTVGVFIIYRRKSIA